MEYTVNNANLQYNTSGKKELGEDVVLLKCDVDLTANTPWNKEGYTVEKFLPSDIYRTFSDNTYSLLMDLWGKAGLVIPENFVLDQYHTLTEQKEKHLAAIEQTKTLPVTSFPVEIDVLEKRVSEICEIPLQVCNPFDNQSIFHFRVIRPGKQDNNPLHRDVWLEDYKDCINLYIPVAGSNEKSSLIIVPESHYWSESAVERTLSGAEINGVKFNVPAVTQITARHQFVRPNPALNELLIFSPYLIHGGSSNLNEDATRISIEIRLWKK